MSTTKILNLIFLLPFVITCSSQVSHTPSIKPEVFTTTTATYTPQPATPTSTAKPASTSTPTSTTTSLPTLTTSLEQDHLSVNNSKPTDVPKPITTPCPQVGSGLTQTEMTSNAYCQATKSEEKMQQLYDKLLHQYSDTPDFARKLKISQSAWLVYRDAHLEALYPVDTDQNPRSLYGSVFSMCYAIQLTSLTDTRIVHLKNLASPSNNDTLSAPKVLQVSEEVEQTMNRVYNEVLEQYADSPVFIDKLKKSQKAWLAYRTTAHPVIYYPSPEIDDFTKSRTQVLQVWLDGTILGDICSGSIRFR